MYRLCMSAAQIARCNTALGREALGLTVVQHVWPANPVGYPTEVVLLDKAGINEVITALRANPQVLGPDDGTLEWINLAGLERCLQVTLDSPEDDGMLHGIQI